MPWKRQPVLLYMPSLHFCLSSLLMRWQYSCALAVLWKMNVFITPGCRVTFTVFLLITDQQSFDGRTAGAGLMGVGVGDLMAVKWLSMKSWTWRLRSLVLYLWNGGTGWYTPFSRWEAGRVGLVSYRVKWGACWVRSLADYPSSIDIWYGVYTIRGGAGANYGVVYGMTTLRWGEWASSCGGSVVYDGIYLGVMFMLNIDTSYYNAAICLSPIFFSGIVWVGLIREWVSSAALWISISDDDILVKGRLTDKNSIVLETISDALLGIYEVIKC